LELTKEAPKESPKEPLKDVSAPEVLGEAISGAFGDLPGFEKSTQESAKKDSQNLTSIQIEDNRKSK